jgi:hypothetical protein
MLALAAALLLTQSYPPFSGGTVINGVDQTGASHPPLIYPPGALAVQSGAIPNYSQDNAYTNGLGSYATAVGPLAGDGGQGIVVTNYSGTTVSCYQFNANGSLARRTDTTVLSGPRMAAMGDFNRDGLTDIAVTNRSSLVGVYFGDGGCGFALGTPNILDAGTITAAQGIAAGLIGSGSNTNTKVSLIVGDRSSFGVAVFVGGGDGGFLPATVQDAGGGGIAQLALTDFNNDGDLDIITVGNSTAGTVSLLEGHDNNTFTNVATYATQSIQPSSLALGDFNSDGIPDVVMVGGSNGPQRAGMELFFGQVNEVNSVGYALNTPSAYFQFASTNAGVCQGVVVGDFNGDGFLDAASSCSSGGSATAYAGILIATGDGRGHLSPLPLVPVGPFPVPNTPIYIGEADLNRDGYQDFLVPNFTGGTGIPNFFTLLSQAPTTIAPALGAAWQVAPVPGSMIGASNGPPAPSYVNCQSAYATFLGTILSRRNITVQSQYDATPVWLGGPNVGTYPGQPISLSDAGFSDGGPFGVPGLELQPGQIISIDVNNNPAFVYGATQSGYAANGLYCIKASGAQDGTPDGGWASVMELP